MTNQQNMQPENNRFGKVEESFRNENNEFVAGAEQTQQLLRKQQDQKLDILLQHLESVKNKASIVSNQLTEHEELLTQMDTETDKAQTGMKGAWHNLNKLVDSTNERTQWAVIGILIVLLIIVVILIFYF